MLEGTNLLPGGCITLDVVGAFVTGGDSAGYPSKARCLTLSLLAEGGARGAPEGQSLLVRIPYRPTMMATAVVRG